MRATAFTTLTLFFAILAMGANSKTKEHLTSYVNPLMGTQAPGNTYPGAQFPFGSVQLSPDNGLSGWERISGYTYSDTIISGFSHMHLSGTGAGDLYDLLFMPINSRSSRVLKENGGRPYSRFSHGNEVASPGYYRVMLQDFGINAEMTASERGGVQRYSFPKDTGKAVILDLGYALNWDSPVETFIKVEDSRTLVGYRKSTGWAADQRVYFKAVFSKPFDSYRLFAEGKEVRGEATAKHTKIMLCFSSVSAEVVEIGVSAASSGLRGAVVNYEKELQGKSFDVVRAEAENAWEKELNKIAVSTTNTELKRTFYTTLYQTMLNPRVYSDVEGYYKAPNGKVEQAKGYTRYELFSLWDTFRAAHPLYTIMHPSRVVDMVKSFMAHYHESGLLPVWSLEGNETNMMIGYHAVPVMVDAYQKGLLKGLDARELYAACKASAMQNEHQIGEYQQRGFVSSGGKEDSWSVSKTLEYAFDDWCIAQLAKSLGLNSDYDYFMKRSESWARHYDSSSSFLRPLNADGSFVAPFNPKEYTGDFCESNAWQYFWFVPHNIEGLIAKLGSKDRFEQKLDSMFSYSPLPGDKLPIFSTGMIGQYAHGNEPGHHVGYLYSFVGKPWKTQAIVRKIALSQYSPTPTGHCGNEDCGQMSAWFVFTAMGFYPVNPASGEYVLAAPLLNKATIRMENGRELTILAKDLSDKNVYVQKVELNGKPIKGIYIKHSDVVRGGKLVFHMGSKPPRSIAE